MHAPPALACLSSVCALEIPLAFSRFKHLPLTEAKGNTQGDFMACPDPGTQGSFGPSHLCPCAGAACGNEHLSSHPHLLLMYRSHEQLQNREHFSRRCCGP